MLELVGDFVPFGSQYADRNPHLVEDTASSQEVDFSAFFEGFDAQMIRSISPSYQLYAVNDQPTRPLFDKSDELPYQHRSPRRSHVINGCVDLEEELYMVGSTVIWSRGQHVVKTFKFEAEKQPVQTALFAWFPFEVLERTDPTLLQTYSSFSTLDKWDDNLDHDRLESRLDFSIVSSFIDQDSHPPKRRRTSATASTGGGQSLSPRSVREGICNGHIVLRKALCVVLRDSVKIYFVDGLTYSVHLPFPVQRAFPLDIGLFLERKRDASVFGALHTSWQPTFIAIDSLTEDAKAVSVSDEVPPWNRSTKEPLFSDITEQHHELLLTTCVADDGLYHRNRRSNQRNRSVAVIVVTLDRFENTHHVWLYTTPSDKQRFAFKDNSFSIPSQKHSTLEQSNKSSSFQNVKKTKRKHPKKGVRRIKVTKQPISLPPPSPVPSTPTGLTRKDSLAQFHEDFSSDTDQIYGSDAGDSFHESMEHNGLILKRLWREPKSPLHTKTSTSAATKAFISHNKDGEEVLCLMNYQQRTLLGLNVKRLLARHPEPIEFQLTAKAAAPICATRRPLYDILVLKDSRLSLVIDGNMSKLDIPLSTQLKIRGTDIKDIRDTVYNRFNLTLSRKRTIRLTLDLSMSSALVRDCIASLSCALPAKLFSSFRERLLQERFRHSSWNHRAQMEWDVFAITFLAHLPLRPVDPRHANNINTNQDNTKEDDDQDVLVTSGPLFSKLNIPRRLVSTAIAKSINRDSRIEEWCHRAMELRTTQNIKTSLVETIPTVLAALHIVYEDYRLSKLKQSLAQKMGQFLLQICDIFGFQNWSIYYKLQGINAMKPMACVSVEGTTSIPITEEPVDFEDLCKSDRPHASMLQELHHTFSLTSIDPSPGVGVHTFASTIKMLWALNRELESATGNHHSLVMRMVDEGWQRGDLESLIPSVSEPLINILEHFKYNPPMQWTIEAFELIGRDDVAQQLRIPQVTTDPNSNRFRLPIEKDTDVVDMHEVMAVASTLDDTSDIKETGILNLESERLRFNYEGVVETVRIMLDSSRMPQLVLPDRSDTMLDEGNMENHPLVKNIVFRTLSLAVGRGIFAYGTYKPNLAKTLSVDSPQVKVRLVTMRTTVQLDEKWLEGEFLDWPNFHCGVAAGLRISPSYHSNSSRLLHSLEHLEPHHGGFLLALGLSGAIKQIPLANWYRFMTQESEMVKAGFILGASVANRGCKDSNIIKLLTVHIPSLLPPESTSLSISNLIQATCLISMGLTYMGSCDRLMTSVLLGEFTRHATGDPSTKEANFESCVLAAGFGIGFIALGCGAESAGVADLQLRDKLYRYMTGQSLVTSKQQKQSASSQSLNLDVTSPAATIALGLIYLRTENVRIAERVDVLDTRPYLNYVRPDFLLIRVVAKNLIMWSTIQPTDEWIDRQLPAFMRHQPAEDGSDDGWDLEVSRQAMYNIVGGACLCIGLRYAGSKHPQAFACLLARLDQLMRQHQHQATTFQEHITKSALGVCMHVVATAAAMVMAGTGDLSLYERLHELYNRVTSGERYGDHMAISMAMGLLFAGLGGYTLKTTNEAIAALLCAFYPFYPLSPDDNRYHLQSFRHLWVLALDVRWLTAFDIDLHKPCRVPLLLTVYEDEQRRGEPRPTRTLRVVAPTVVPSYDIIHSIQVDSPRYLPLRVDIASKSPLAISVTKSGVVCVQRKQGCLTYDQDPRGSRSLYT